MNENATIFVFCFFCNSLSIMPYYVLRKHCWVETVLKVQHCWTTLICTVVCASQIIQNYDCCWVMKTHFKIFRGLNQYGIQLRTHINNLLCSTLQYASWTLHLSPFFTFKKTSPCNMHYMHTDWRSFSSFMPSNRSPSMCWPQSMITYIRKYIPYVISWISSVLSVILGWFTNLDSSSVKK